MALSKETVYTMEYPPEKLKFREHFSSLLLSGDLSLTLLELGSLGGLAAAAWLLPPDRVNVKGSWTLKELAAFLCTKAVVTRVYKTYLEAVFFTFPQYRTQPSREHALKNKKDLCGRDMRSWRQLFIMTGSLWSVSLPSTWVCTMPFQATILLRMWWLHCVSEPCDWWQITTCCPLHVLDASGTACSALAVGEDPFISPLGQAPPVTKHLWWPLAGQSWQCRNWAFLCSSTTSVGQEHFLVLSPHPYSWKSGEAFRCELQFEPRSSAAEVSTFCTNATSPWLAPWRPQRLQLHLHFHRRFYGIVSLELEGWSSTWNYAISDYLHGQSAGERRQVVHVACWTIQLLFWHLSFL